MNFHRKYTCPLTALAAVTVIVAGFGSVSQLTAQTPDTPLSPSRDGGSGPR
ncbi:MAG TPA: hypothetical protein VGD78_13320 [Chthoniobacterales bacterium]